MIIMSQRYFGMAKEKSKVKSKIQAKTPAKSSKPSKVVTKAAVKHKPVIKAKVQVKTVAKVVVKQVAKSASKPAAKVAAPKLVKKDTKTTAVKKTEIVVKKTSSEKDKKIEVKKNDTKIAESKDVPVKSTKTDSKAKPSKVKKTEKKEADFEDDLTLDDDFGDSEISDYEDDLKSVEELDEEDFTEISDDDDDEQKDEEVYLTDSEGRRLCRVRDCDQVATVDGYCRYHYLLLWKKIQIRKSILLDGKLEKYILDLTSRYPDKFLEMIKKDMKSDKEFLAVIQELEIDEGALNDMDNNDEETQSFADEIRGIGDAPSMDDDGDY